MARAGGKDAARLGEALDAARDVLLARSDAGPVRVLALDYGSGRTGVGDLGRVGHARASAGDRAACGGTGRVSPSCLRSSSVSGPS